MASAIASSTNTIREVPDFDAALDEVAGHLNTQHARLVDLTVTLIAHENQWRDVGLHSPELFLAWRVGLSPHHARQIVAIARRADELPDSTEAFRRGQLAVDQMAAIAQRAPWWIDQEISELATMLTVNQLRNTLAKYPFPDIPRPGDEPSEADTGDSTNTGDENDPEATGAGDSPNDDSADDGSVADDTSGGDGTDPTPGAGRRPAPEIDARMWWGVGDDGVFRLHAQCDPLTGMIIDAALQEARDALFQAGNTDVSDIDALLEIAQRSLDTVAEPTRRDRFRTNIHLHTDGTATDAHGWTLPDAIRRYITCDGLLSPVFITGDIPISVGRTQRTIPQRTRRLVLLRDQGCRIPGCNQTHHLEVHHIIHWEDDGPTDTWNLTQCQYGPSADALRPRSSKPERRRRCPTAAKREGGSWP